MAWSSLGSLTVQGYLQPFPIPLIGNAVVRIAVSLEGDLIYRLNRIDFIENYIGGLSRYLFALPVKDLDTINELIVPTGILSAGFGVRQLNVKHNLLGLSDNTALVAEAFVWEVDPIGNPPQIIDFGTYND